MAASKAADGTGPPPLELEYAWTCKEYNTLPNDGGLRNQPVALMIKMRATFNVWRVFKEYFSNGLSPEWTMNNHEKWELIVQIMKLRRELEEGE